MQYLEKYRCKSTQR